MERGLPHRLCSSLPIIGPALGIFIEHVELGCQEHGRFWGLLRGLTLGLVLMASLIAISEGVLIVFEITRYEAHMRWTAPTKAAQRSSAVDRELKDQDAHRLVFGHTLTLPQPVSYFVVSPRGMADIANGLVTPAELLELLADHDEYKSGVLATLPRDWPITPFRFRNDQYGVAHGEVPGKGECAFASFDDGTIIFIPLREYHEAHQKLMKEAR